MRVPRDVPEAGFEPTFRGSEPRILPLDDSGMCCTDATLEGATLLRGIGWTRTTNLRFKKPLLLTS